MNEILKSKQNRGNRFLNSSGEFPIGQKVLGSLLNECLVLIVELQKMEYYQEDGEPHVASEKPEDFNAGDG